MTLSYPTLRLSQTFWMGPNQDKVATLPFLEWLWLTHWGQELVASCLLPFWAWGAVEPHLPTHRALRLVRDLEYWEIPRHWVPDSRPHVAAEDEPCPCGRGPLSCQQAGG